MHAGSLYLRHDMEKDKFVTVESCNDFESHIINDFEIIHSFGVFLFYSHRT